MTEHRKIGVLVILPVLNEAENVEPLLEGIRHELMGIPHTVCLIDDGSKDGTVDIIHRLSASGDHNLHLIQRSEAAPFELGWSGGYKTPNTIFLLRWMVIFPTVPKI
jgi:glycosyltransferase involved in cell wall biosynthesis